MSEFYPAWDGSIVRLTVNPARTVDYLASDRLPRRLYVVESRVSQLHYLAMRHIHGWLADLPADLVLSGLKWSKTAALLLTKTLNPLQRTMLISGGRSDLISK
jgi:hypothetical protein